MCAWARSRYLAHTRFIRSYFDLTTQNKTHKLEFVVEWCAHPTPTAIVLHPFANKLIYRFFVIFGAMSISMYFRGCLDRIEKPRQTQESHQFVAAFAKSMWLGLSPNSQFTVCLCLEYVHIRARWDCVYPQGRIIPHKPSHKKWKTTFL